MSEEENERDFMKVCFNVVAGLEVKNESQAIAKEVILDEVENLTKENKQLQNNWNELKNWLEENESFDDYCNETTFTSVLNKMQELEGSDENNEKI